MVCWRSFFFVNVLSVIDMSLSMLRLYFIFHFFMFQHLFPLYLSDKCMFIFPTCNDAN